MLIQHNHWPNFWTDLRTVIKAAWPEVGQIFRVPQVQRINWTNLIEKGSIVPPWCVVQIPPVSQNNGWGVGNVAFSPSVHIYYIDSQRNADMGGYLESKLSMFEDNLLQTSVRFTILEQLGMDFSEENPVNRSMLDANMPFVAGSYHFMALFGYVPNA